MIRIRLAIGVMAAVVALAGLPAGASAAVGTVAISGGTAPVPMSLSTFSGVSLSFGFDATYSGGFNPVPSRATFHFDNDIAFDTTGLPRCSPGAIAGTTTAQALSACGAAKVGSGNALLNAGALTGVVTAFNGTQVAGHDSLLLHIDIQNGAVIEVWVGPLGSSSLGGDYGTQLDFLVPITPFGAFTHLAVVLDNLEPTPGHHYVSARCSDLDRTLNFAAEFTYFDSSTRSASATQTCPPTGMRAAALKKCKKKQSAKARKRCRRRALLLPV